MLKSQNDTFNLFEKKIENGTKEYHKTSNDIGQYGIFQYHWTVQSTYC